VRAYSDDPGAPVFLEVKARVDRVIHKRRVRMPRQHAVAVLPRRVRWWDLFVPGAARGDLDQFASRVALSRCEPLVRIRYDREAYVACPPEPVRVTFDTNLCFQPTFGPDLSLTTGRWSPVPIGGVILEIKFSGAGPSWIGHMVRCFSLQRVPCCKFARAVTCMQRADPARMAARRLGAPHLAA
jgi:hypothetical protein